MALDRDKYDIEIRNDDTIKRNQIFFYFMQRIFNFLDGLYLRERYLLIYTIMRDQLRNQSASESEKLNREKKYRKKRKEGTSKSSPKTFYFVNNTTRTSRGKVTPPIQIFMLTYHN